MNFRGKRSTRKAVNDGLPVINGKKVRHRSKELSISHRNSSSGGSIFWILATVAAVILFVLNGNNEAGGVDSDNKVAVAPAAPVKTTSTTAATSAEALAEKARADMKKRAEEKARADKSIDDKLPPKCTEEQFTILKKQLPTSPNINVKPAMASFSIATVQTAHPYNPILAREFYASKDFKLDTSKHSFFGVTYGYYGFAFPVDFLAIGSRDTTKYKTEGMQKALPMPEIDTSEGTRPAKYLAVQFENGDSVNVPQLDGLVGLKNLPQPHRAIEMNWPQINEKTADDQPIHFLEFNSPPGDEVTLISLMLKDKILQRTRFLHITYNSRGDWNFYKLSRLTTLLREQGLVCYWAGKKEADYALWRITDCFVDYFDINHWAEISCVNNFHEDTKVLADRMEQKFLETLKKDHTFPGQ